jgi:hypothetical protein
LNKFTNSLKEKKTELVCGIDDLEASAFHIPKGLRGLLKEYLLLLPTKILIASKEFW